MMYLVCLLCVMPQAGVNDPRDEKIKAFLNDPKREAVEAYLWNNPNHEVTLNDIMMVFKKQYNLDIAINYKAFNKDVRRMLLDQPIKRIEARGKHIPRGLALQLYLDNFKQDLTYHVEHGTIWIVPGKSTFADESKDSSLGDILRTSKPKYDTQLNKERTNPLQVPPTNLLGALRFFGAEDRGDYHVFARERDLPQNIYQMQVKVPPYSEKSYDYILRDMLKQVNASYIIHNNCVVIVPNKAAK